MPRSCPLLRSDIKKYLVENFDKNSTILDVGPGEGTYYNLLNDYFVKFDAVEVWESYINTYGLRTKYDNVYNENILDFEFDYYDIIIMGDIVEHISRDKAVELIEKIVEKCNQVLLVVPYNLPQGPKGGVKYEEHLQPDLNDEIMEKYYPKLKLLNYNGKDYKVKGSTWNGDYCAFIKK